MNTDITLKTNKFEQDLNVTIDNLLQDVYVASEEGYQAMQRSSEEYLNQFTRQLQQAIDVHGSVKGQSDAHSRVRGHSMRDINGSGREQLTTTVTPPHTSTRFPDVHLDPRFHRLPNPYESSSSLPDYNNNRHVTAYGMQHNGSNNGFRAADKHNHAPQPIPTMVQVNRNTTGDIPPLNHDQAIKRAKIQFTGLGDIFVSYNQLMNGMDQFGIYLIPLNSVSYQTDLCPTHYQVVPIPPHRRRQMASTLYKKLQDTDVIPMDYTAIRNIINRYTEENDGYKVLYSMLELVHPALQRDAVILPPKSDECNDDIHMYAQKIDAWLRYETYANQPYSTREQINLFIRELSATFASAVSRI